MTINPKIRRTLIIIAFIAIVSGMVFAIYWFFFRGLTIPISNQNTNQGAVNGLPSIGNGNVNTISNTGVTVLPNTNEIAGAATVANGGATHVYSVVPNQSAGVTVNGSSGNLQYYDRTSGKFYQLSPDGTSRSLLTDATYPNVQTITWDPNGNQAILTFPDNSKILYDFRTKKQTTLPSELYNFSFSPSGEQLASQYLDGEDESNQWLMVSKPDGTQSKSVEQLGENASKVVTDWSPNNQVIATFENSVNSGQSEIIFLGQNDENFLSAEVQGRGFTPNYSPDGKRIIFSTYSAETSNAPHLYVMSGEVSTLGQNIVDLGLNTRADKCTFSQNGYTVYCAVPYYLVENSGISPSLGYEVPDNIYAIDLLRGTTSLIARPVNDNNEQSYSVGTMQLSVDETAIYFTDAQTGYVHKIAIR